MTLPDYDHPKDRNPKLVNSWAKIQQLQALIDWLEQLKRQAFNENRKKCLER